MELVRSEKPNLAYQYIPLRPGAVSEAKRGARLLHHSRQIFVYFPDIWRYDDSM